MASFSRPYINRNGDKLKHVVHKKGHPSDGWPFG